MPMSGDDSLDPLIRGNIDDAVKEQGVSLLIQAVAERSANAAVKNTFFLLGVDIADPKEVETLRDSFKNMREDTKRKAHRKEIWASGIVHGAITVATAAIIAVLGGFLSGFNFKFHS